LRPYWLHGTTASAQTDTCAVKGRHQGDRMKRLTADR